MEAKSRPGMGTHERFPGVTCPVENRHKVVTCNSLELYQLLRAPDVEWITKFYSAYANVFRFTAKAISTYADIWTFAEAQAHWAINDPVNIPAVEYQIAVSTYILGACYTVKKNAAKQIARRLTACRASMG